MRNVEINKSGSPWKCFKSLPVLLFITEYPLLVVEISSKRVLIVLASAYQQMNYFESRKWRNKIGRSFRHFLGNEDQNAYFLDARGRVYADDCCQYTFLSMQLGTHVVRCQFTMWPGKILRILICEF